MRLFKIRIRAAVKARVIAGLFNAPQVADNGGQVSSVTTFDTSSFTTCEVSQPLIPLSKCEYPGHSETLTTISHGNWLCETHSCGLSLYGSSSDESQTISR